MLTIKAPITCKCTTPIITSQEGFYHRITSNYDMMNSHITSEDLLHLVTTPPEIYFAEGGGTNILAQTNINNNNINHVEIINNLMNRLMLTDQIELTYQDRVYITTMLHKLGVKNEKQFISQLTKLKQQTEDTTEMINLYWENMIDMRQVVEQVENLVQQQNNENITQNVQPRYYLHDEILNRLQTAAIYQIVESFSKNEAYQTLITNQEISLAEQHRLIQNTLLQRLQDSAHGTETPLTYRYENFYETEEIEEENVSKQEITNKLSSAVLLSMIDSLYQSRFEQKSYLGDIWYRLDRALYQSVDNTINRMGQETYQVQVEQNQINHYLTKIDESFKQEIEHVQVSQVSEDEQLQQALLRIDKKNTENYQKFREYITRETTQAAPKRKTVSRKEAIAQSIKALDNPEEVLMTLRMEGEKQAEQQKEIKKRSYEELPPAQARVMRLLEEYMQSPESVMQKGLVVANPEAVLQQDIVQLEHRIQDKEVETKLESQTVREVSQEVVKQLQDKKTAAAVVQDKYIDTNSQINMVHRRNESVLDEEVIQELVTQNRTMKKQTERIEETLQQTTQTQKVIKQTNVQQTTQQIENIQEMIQRGITAQMGQMSERVYSQLERRLSDEKKRRGL